MFPGEVAIEDMRLFLGDPQPFHIESERKGLSFREGLPFRFLHQTQDSLYVSDRFRSLRSCLKQYGFRNADRGCNLSFQCRDIVHEFSKNSPCTIFAIPNRLRHDGPHVLSRPLHVLGFAWVVPSVDATVAVCF